MCGENVSSIFLKNATMGSPPHVRGKRTGLKQRRDDTGITPACAGKTSCLSSSSTYVEDHPRMCGENFPCDTSVITSGGSPPHVRGKLTSGTHGTTASGITPACAGKTCPGRDCKVRQRDHPRMCGENMCADFQTRKAAGSPPHVRGKPSGTHNL